MIMNKNSKYLFLLAVVFIVFIGLIIVWQANNKAYFNYDSLRHYLASVNIFDKYNDGLNEAFFSVNKYSKKHSFLVYAINSLVYFLVGPTQNNSVMINSSIFIGILLFSLYNIGRLVKGYSLGVLSCVIVLLYPVVFNQAKVYMLDLPLLSVVTLSIYLLIKCDYFRSKKYSLLFMFSFFMGVLIKINFLCFIVVPLFFVIFERIRKYKINPYFFLAAGFIVSGFLFLYFYISPVFLRKIILWLFKLKGSGVVVTWIPQELREVPFLVHKLRALFWYLWGFINWQANLLFFILFLAGMWAFLKSNNLYKKIIVSWIFFSYLLMSWFVYAIDVDMEVTGVRYSMPLLGGVSLITSYGLLSLKKRFLRKMSIGLVVIFGVVNMILLSFPVFKESIKCRINLNQDKYHVLPSYINIYSSEPLIISGTNWLSRYDKNDSSMYKDVYEIFSYIDSFYDGKKINVFILSDGPQWHHLKFLAYKYNKDIEFSCDYVRLLYEDVVYSRKPVCSLIEEADFVVEVEDRFAELYLVDFMDKLKDCFTKKKGDFKLIKEFPGSKVFKRRM